MTNEEALMLAAKTGCPAFCISARTGKLHLGSHDVFPLIVFEEMDYFAVRAAYHAACAALQWHQRKAGDLYSDEKLFAQHDEAAGVLEVWITQVLEPALVQKGGT